MPQGSSPSPYDDSRRQRIEAFVREAEAFLASRGGLDPSALPALAYQHGLERDEFQEAMYLVYSSPPKGPPSSSSADPNDQELFPPEVLAENATLSTVAEEANTASETLVPAVLSDDYEIPGVRPQDLFNFVRQARLILADDRGWNEHSLARLNYLADDLLIPHAVRPDLFRKLDDPHFNPPAPSSETADDSPILAEVGNPQPIETVPNAAQEEEEEEARQKEERKKRHSPSRLYTHYLKKALEALSTKRVNQRREEKLIREGTTKLGLSEVLARDLLLEVAHNMGYVLLSEIQEQEDANQQVASEELLVDFQQRAATIIAGQGGVNSLTRIMIAQVATDLGLSDEQRDAALASIQKQTEKNEVDTRLQQRAASFHEFVRVKLDAIAHGIVIASLAQKLVQIGVDMHGIDEEMAWHTLREVLQEEDLRLVTVEQAKSHISALIDDIMIQEQFLSIQNRQRLMAEGEQWGLTPGRCEQLIDQHVADFTRRKHRSQRQVAMIFAAFFGLLVAGGVYVIYLESTPPRGVPSGPEVTSSHRSASSPGPLVENTKPLIETPQKPVWQRQPWWGEKLSLALLGIYQQEPSLQEPLTAICTDNEKRRINAYRQLIPLLVTTSVAHPGEAQQLAIRDAIVGLVRDDPSDAAVAAIAEELTTGVVLSDPSVLAATLPAQRLEKAYLSVLAADQTALPAVRKDAFLDKLAQQLGITYSSSISPMELTINEIVRDQYRRLRELAAADPNLAAQSHTALSQAAKNYLPQEQITAKDSILAATILSQMTDNWEAYKATVETVIHSQKPEHLLPVLDAFSQTLRDATIHQELAELLSQRIGRSLDVDNPVEAASLVRTELGLDSIAASDGEMQRMFSQRASVFSWDIPDDLPPDMLANEVSKLSFLSVLGHAADKGELGQRIFADTLNKGAPEPDDRSPLSNAKSTERLRALSKVESFISKFPTLDPNRMQVSDKDPRNLFNRMNNYRDLCEMANNVDDIDYESASILAMYLLAKKPQNEQSQLLIGLRAFSHWTNFKLAMADYIHASPRAPDDLQVIVSTVLGETISITDVRTADDQLRNALLRHALDNLGSHSAGPESLSAKAANNTASFLVDHYRLHARLEGISNEQLAGLELPDAIADLLIEMEQNRINGMSLTDSESTQLEDITRQKIAMNYLSTSPIASMAVRQRIWLKLLALRLSKERPQLKVPLAQLLKKLETEDANASTLFEQLRSGEMALVQFWEITGGAV
ncbi:hypothetical protein [Blastopirellula marina]|uniref:Uncharacterized protein n=1 Tax=Blastopirellula marina TaxID=124 RepID=A0A2S8FWX1_9BACT|nr:hypothetical protein [Blastopirellula marina]PQO36681.1 hypothetical protein C5Y98_11860 [Blastopirellula marina]PTL44511.1 hypothetical protein C5Y97_11870 [Blastopirellula marina]